MRKRTELVFLGARMMILGFIIVAFNRIMWKSGLNSNLKSYRLFYLADKFLENIRAEFISAEKYYLLIYGKVALQTAN